MKLRIGDTVEFKKYGDMTVGETMWISEELFPKYGKITEVVSDDFFYIEGDGYLFNPKSVTRIISSKKEGLAMKLEIGDVVEFKKCEDMTVGEAMGISEESFPKYGKIIDVRTHNAGNVYFNIEGSLYNFNSGSVARIISDVDDVDINNLNVGDEVLAKVTVKGIFADGIRISSQIKTSDVVKILKRKEPEHFIVQEDHYGMYIGTARELVSDKSKAKLHASLDAANEAATDMQLDDWDVIPYDD